MNFKKIADTSFKNFQTYWMSLLLDFKVKKSRIPGKIFNTVTRLEFLCDDIGFHIDCFSKRSVNFLSLLYFLLVVCCMEELVFFFWLQVAIIWGSWPRLFSFKIYHYILWTFETWLDFALCRMVFRLKTKSVFFLILLAIILFWDKMYFSRHPFDKAFNCIDWL